MQFFKDLFFHNHQEDHLQKPSTICYVAFKDNPMVLVGLICVTLHQSTTFYNAQIRFLYTNDCHQKNNSKIMLINQVINTLHELRIPYLVNKSKKDIDEKEFFTKLDFTLLPEKGQQSNIMLFYKKIT